MKANRGARESKIGVRLDLSADSSSQQR